MKVRNSLILVFTLFAILAVASFSIFSGMQLKGAAESQYDKMISSVAQTQARSFDQYFSLLAAQVKTINENYAVQAMSKEISDGKVDKESDNFKAALDYLAAYVESDSGITKIILTDDNGKVIMANDKGYIGTTAEIDLENVVDYRVYVDAAGSSSKSSQYELYVKSDLAGYNLLVYFENARITRMFSQSTFPTNGRIVIADPKDMLLDTTFVGSLAADKLASEYAAFKDYILNVTVSGVVKTRYEIGKNERIAHMVSTGESDWTVIALAEANKAYAYSNDASGTINGIAILVAVVLCAASIVLVVIITKPLYKIEETLLKIKRGDHEARIDILANNEYGEIARAFNDLVDNIIVSEGRYRTIIEMSDNIIFEWNFKTNEVTFSQNFNKKFSYRAPSDHFGDSFLLKCKVHPDDADRYKADLEKLSKGEDFKHNEYRWKNIYGDYIWILMRTATIRDRENNIIKVVGVIVDIDRAKKSEKLLTTRASFDSLTGLYNRETIETAINNEIDLIAARKNQFAILFVDIDDFKIYNDKYSHATGDQVLKFTADSIQSIISEFGMAGRYGGDEFIVCIRNAETNDPSRVAQELLNKLKEGFTCDSGEKLTVNVSIGISIISDNSKRVDEIIGMADDAMYRIKKSGKSNFGYLDR